MHVIKYVRTTVLRILKTAHFDSEVTRHRGITINNSSANWALSLKIKNKNLEMVKKICIGKTSDVYNYEMKYCSYCSKDVYVQHNTHISNSSFLLLIQETCLGIFLGIVSRHFPRHMGIQQRTKQQSYLQSINTLAEEIDNQANKWMNFQAAVQAVQKTKAQEGEGT